MGNAGELSPAKCINKCVGSHAGIIQHSMQVTPTSCLRSEAAHGWHGMQAQRNSSRLIGQHGQPSTFPIILLSPPQPPTCTNTAVPKASSSPDTGWLKAAKQAAAQPSA